MLLKFSELEPLVELRSSILEVTKIDGHVEQVAYEELEYLSCDNR